MIPFVDAASPWFAPLRPWIGRLPAAAPSVAAALQAVAGPGSPHFVPAAALPPGEAYEAFIARSGSVPTRDDLHDLLNGLAWQAWPALKRRMNRLQADAIAADGVTGRRGPLRDALTLFDEFGAWWPDAPPVLADALRRRDWPALFIEHRGAWTGAAPQVVGHALLEQLATAPRPGLCAHLALADPLDWSAADWAAKPFLALPVLGIPGWWPANQDPEFYADTRVFRPVKA